MSLAKDRWAPLDAGIWPGQAVLATSLWKPGCEVEIGKRGAGGLPEISFPPPCCGTIAVDLDEFRDGLPYEIRLQACVRRGEAERIWNKRMGDDTEDQGWHYCESISARPAGWRRRWGAWLVSGLIMRGDLRHGVFTSGRSEGKKGNISGHSELFFPGLG